MIPLPSHEDAALEVLRRSGSLSSAVDLDKVALVFDGLTIKEVDLDAEGYLLDVAALGSVILVRRESQPMRKRYTVAHEIGHLYLIQSGIRESGGSSEHIAIEQWCDSFAAALLMPAESVQQAIGQFDNWGDVLHLAPGMLGVSREAFTNRITQIRDIAFFYVDPKSWTVVGSYITGKRFSEDLQDHVASVIRFMRSGVLKRDYYDETLGLWFRYSSFRTKMGPRIILAVEGVAQYNRKA